MTGIAYTSNAGATTIDTLGWGYDAASNVTSFSSIDGTAAYGYDPTNRLTSATYTTASGGHQPANENFSFDANGNRNMSGYTTGGDNLMSSDGTYNYEHDADGNTISRTQIASTYSTQYLTTYTWDYRNRLTDVEYYDNNDVLTKHVHYVYGVFDHLLATEVDPTGGGTYTQIQHYVLDVSPEIPQAGVPGTALAQPVLGFGESGNLTERNLVALNPAAVDAVVAQESVSSPTQAGVVTWVADDHLGSPVDVVNNSGGEDDHIVRSAFGQVAYESNPAATPWAGFGGGHEDPNTGLVNDYHRYYDPATGRWISEDPAGFAGDDTNLARYSSNAITSRDDEYWFVDIFDWAQCEHNDTDIFRAGHQCRGRGQPKCWAGRCVRRPGRCGRLRPRRKRERRHTHHGYQRSKCNVACGIELLRWCCRGYPLRRIRRLHLYSVWWILGRDDCTRLRGGRGDYSLRSRISGGAMVVALAKPKLFGAPAP